MQFSFKIYVINKLYNMSSILKFSEKYILATKSIDYRSMTGFLELKIVENIFWFESMDTSSIVGHQFLLTNMYFLCL